MADLQLSDAELDHLADVLADRVAARLTAPEPAPTLVTVGQAARLLGCHPKTVRRRIEAGVLSAVHEQGRVLLRAEELHGYVESLGRAGSSPPARRRRRPRRRDYGFLREQ